MALPYTIVNGDDPDATVIMANFNYLAGGSGIASGTYTAHKATAVAAPTVPFLCTATGTDGLAKGLFFYCADISAGDNGFLLLAGW